MVCVPWVALYTTLGVDSLLMSPMSSNQNNLMEVQNWPLTLKVTSKTTFATTLAMILCGFHSFLQLLKLYKELHVCVYMHFFLNWKKMLKHTE